MRAMSGCIQDATKGRHPGRPEAAVGFRRHLASWGTLALLGLAGASGCAAAPSNRPAGETCLRASECAPGLACVEGLCSADLGAIGGMLPNLEAGAPDAMAMADGSMDGPPADGAMDSGMDSGPVDSGMDSGPVDSGMDSGPVDSGAADSGPVDSGPADSGPADSGPADSGPVDSGSTDSGLMDAATAG